MTYPFLFLAKKILTAQGIVRFYLVVLIFLFMIGAAYFVYEQGGTSLSSVHLLYIPILMAGIFFGVSGGVISAVLSAILVGPFMPFDVAAHIDQPAWSWGVRGLYFLFVGGFAGISSHVFRDNMAFLERQLTTNSLTNLPNLRGFESLWDTIPPGRDLCVIHIHQLNSIDKALGPAATQFIVKDIATKIQKIVRGKAIIGHFDTGSFALYPTAITSPEQLIDYCRMALGNLFFYDDIPLFLEIFYGIASPGTPFETAGSLIRKARIAIDQSILLSREKSRYDEKDDAQAGRSLRILHDLSAAIGAEQLILFYQPKINLKTGDVQGIEALVRWPHPTLGMISPGEFIPLAEQTVLINPFTRWVLDTALSQLSLWHKSGFQIRLALNFSMRNFQDPTLFSTMNTLLKKHEIPPSFLEIEVTETAVANSLSEVADVMRSFQDLGIKIAIDDFGTGQSSLQYLFALPVDVLKIDQLFIKAMTDNSAADAIVRSAIFLGHELGLTVVAEGIETEGQFKKLKDLGCDEGQGFYIAKPLPSGAMTAWLSGHRNVIQSIL